MNYFVSLFIYQIVIFLYQLSIKVIGRYRLLKFVAWIRIRCRSWWEISSFNRYSFRWIRRMRLFVWALGIKSFTRNRIEIVGLFLRNSGLGRMKMICRVRLLPNFVSQKEKYNMRWLKIKKCCHCLILRLEIYIVLKLTSWYLENLKLFPHKKMNQINSNRKMKMKNRNN